MYGVETADAAGMATSLRAGDVVELATVGLFADGAAVRRVGAETFRLCQAHADGIITVTTDQVCEAIKATFNDTRTIVEPAGALAVAGMTKFVRDEHEAMVAAAAEAASAGAGEAGEGGEQHPPQPPRSMYHRDSQLPAAGALVAICSGANMDFDRLRFVSERADSSEVPIAVTIPERSGAFHELYDDEIIYPRNSSYFYLLKYPLTPPLLVYHSLLYVLQHTTTRYDEIYPRNVTEFSYRLETATKEAHIFMSYQAAAAGPPGPGLGGVGGGLGGLGGGSARQQADCAELHAKLEARGFGVVELRDNEMAKVHARHLAGGRSAAVKSAGDELVRRAGLAHRTPSAPARGSPTLRASLLTPSQPAVPLRVSGAAGRAQALPGRAGPRLERLAVPLPQPRRRHWARVSGHPGAAGRARRRAPRRFPREPRLRVLRGDGQRRVPAIPTLIWVVQGGSCCWRRASASRSRSW